MNDDGRTAAPAMADPHGLSFAIQGCGACGFLTSTAFATAGDAGSRTWLAARLAELHPAVLYVLGQSSWNRFHSLLGACVRRDPPISVRPADKDFTLLRETTDLKRPTYLELDTPAGRHRARLVIAPRLADHGGSAPQFRLSPSDWRKLVHEQPSCIAVMTPARGFAMPPPPEDPDDYVVVRLHDEPARARAAIGVVKEFPAAWHVLAPGYYDPQAMMASVLEDMYARGQLSWSDRSEAAGFLARGAAP